jgi:hypothetical protein
MDYSAGLPRILASGPPKAGVNSSRLSPQLGWVDGVCRLVGPHPDTPDDAPPAGIDLTRVASLLAPLRLRFVTVDLARRTDGVWRVVELGDGQVSDRPSTVAPETMIATLGTA